MDRDYDEFEIDSIIEMLRNDIKKANEAEAREREKAQKKEEKVEPVTLKGEGIFRDRDALIQAHEREKAKKRAVSGSTGDPFDEMFRVLGVSAEEVDKRVKGEELVPFIGAQQYESPYPSPSDDIDFDYIEDPDIFRIIPPTSSRSISDDLSAMQFFGRTSVSSDTKTLDESKVSPYERIKQNSVGKKDKRKNNRFTVLDVVKEHAVKVFVVSAVIGILFTAKAGVNAADSKIDNDFIDRHGVQTLSYYSNYDYDDIFYSGSETIPYHVEAAVEFYENSYRYKPEYRLLSIYQTYDNNYKGGNRLHDMDKFLSDVRELAHKSNSTLQIEIAGQRCFLEYALHVVEKGTGEDITKYDGLIEEYIEIRQKYPGEPPYNYLSQRYQKLADQLMAEYREYSDELYVDFIKEVKSGGIRR